MKQSTIQTKSDLAVFFLMALLSGFMIGVGGTASLLASATLGAWGKLVGACLFSLGIFVIITKGMKLFTGMVADIPTLRTKALWQLPLCFLGNAIGVALVAVLARFSPIGDTVSFVGANLILGKLSASSALLKSFCSAVLCGWLITLSVWAPIYAPKRGLSATVGVLLPIIVFAFCGFDHSVANMLYFFFLGECSWRVVGYILLSILGNIVGGVLLPLVMLFKSKVDAKNEDLEAK